MRISLRAEFRSRAPGLPRMCHAPSRWRGIGLVNKLHAYQLQDQGLDTVEANEHLGFAADLRTYDAGALMLKDFGVRRIRLLTNNPRKVVGLEAHGVEVVERLPLIAPVRPGNRQYLQTKSLKLGHLFDYSPERFERIIS